MKFRSDKGARGNLKKIRMDEKKLPKFHSNPSNSQDILTKKEQKMSTT